MNNAGGARRPILTSRRSALVRIEEANRPPPGVVAARRQLGWPEEEAVVVHREESHEAWPGVTRASTSMTAAGLPQWTVDRSSELVHNTGQRTAEPAGRSVVFDVMGEPWEVVSNPEEQPASSSGHNPSGSSEHNETIGPSPSTPGIDRRRRLAPPTPCQANKRAKDSLQDALQISQCRALRDQAQSEYAEAIYAQQTINSKNALRQTWSKVSRALGHEPVPLTAPHIHEVAAAYCSATSYLYEAVQWYRRLGFPTSDVLHLAVQDAKRAVARAIGPCRKAPEVRLGWLGYLRTHGPRDEGHRSWPVDRYETWVFAVRYVLREQELACVFIKDMEVNERNRHLTLCLPVSKADPTGRGARRTLSCICSSSPEEAATCPSCVGKTLKTRQEQRLHLQPGSNESGDVPLIGQRGNPALVVEKIAMIDAFRYDVGIISGALPEAHSLIAA